MSGGNFSIIAGPNRHGIAAIVPAAPGACTYVRIVEFDAGRTLMRELVYWDSAEWQAEDDDLSCMGAIMGAIKQVNDGADFAEQRAQHAVHCPWELVSD